MSLHDVRFPGESDEYRTARNTLLEAELELRAQVEKVALLRRALPLGGRVDDYEFEGPQGSVSLSDLFGKHSTLIVYSFMYGADAEQPCPMCSAYLDSLNGQMKHINQRASLVVVARSEYPRIAAMVSERGWQDVPWYSSAGNNYPLDYKSEMPNGALLPNRQVPMANVFVKNGDDIRHFWNSETFFAQVPNAPSSHPRHIDPLWPLWSYFDLTPEGRGDFMPGLEY